MSLGLPSPEYRAKIIDKFSELIEAIEAHPAWNPPNPHKGLFHVWDYVNRSRYIMTELDHIRDGEPVQYPEQIPQQDIGVPGRSGPDAATEAFIDVCGRSATINKMIANPKLLTMIGLPQVDYGKDIVSRSQAVVDVLKKAF
ncbi:hypothetical protein CORC01_11914 [Colletotrichum orchidophilum]|uniref:Uncharacterized protein n=1 Tax=Colletotrichum orchidophilum TaxID=1209926 RepID=A0A1G4AUE1_9PEZI|nr:uncharacterized protein CORC01_11914 [Colletotrichum orchidophilum]OHE92764.1 hypothetical protein CORC01_11914 [Colletotrichum orchidophilum]